MPAPTDLNSRIALAKGWRWDDHHPYFLGTGTYPSLVNPEGYGVACPDYVGTVEGVDAMMRELNETRVETAAPYYDWSLRWSAVFQIWDFYGEDEATGERRVQFQSTKEEGSGVAVGKAYMSVFGKEDNDGLLEV